MTHRRLFTCVAAIAAFSLIAACSSDSDDADGGDGASATTTTTSTTTTTAPPDPIDDQSAPAGSNGIALVDELTAWVAVLDGHELVRVLLETGEIVDRIALADGAGPDDVAISDDGVLYWTGYTSGTVGAINLDTGEETTVATLPFGANPIAVAPDGSLLVGLAVIDTGLYRLDPTTAAATDVEPFIADDQAMNAFAVGEDGFLYGPTVEGSVLKTDIESGEIVGPVVSGLGFVVSVRFAPDGSMWALTSVGEPRLSQIDPETGVVAQEIALDQTVADNFAIAADGTMYVTGFNEPSITVVNPEDQSLSTVSIGAA